MRRRTLSTILLGVILAGCLPDLCENEIIKTVASPGGTYKAVVFQRDCGATTDFSTQVSVLPAGTKLPNSGGNVFVGTTARGAAPPGPGGGPVVDVQWINDGRLLVTYDARAEVFRKEDRYRQVLIVYQPGNR